MVITNMDVIISPINVTKLHKKRIKVDIESISDKEMVIASDVEINKKFFYNCLFKLGSMTYINAIIKVNNHTENFNKHIYSVDLITLSKDEISTIRTFILFKDEFPNAQ